ncbi:MAG: cellulase family glycosylhydrolase [Paludibacter sp.]|nr:cellulase family glycosylhydrolase [Paludibacter sp.]
MKKALSLAITALLLLFISCKSNEPAATLSSTRDSLVYVIEGGTDSITIITNTSHWDIKSTADWATVSVNSGTETVKKIKVTVAANSVKQQRTAKLIITGVNTDSVFVKITQITKSSNGTDYPDYSDSIPADINGMGSTAKQLAKQMYMGWNVGNSLEVPAGETGWGNPMISQTLIDSIKAAGINTIRIPCAWDSHVSDGATCKISANWLTRVKQVVDYCYKNNMYVILNIHWDGGWLENNPTYAKQSLINSKQRAYWEQIATYFKDYDEHLLFAGTNEVHKDYNTPSTENFAVQLSFNQTFVNAVRSCGGKNYYRNLVIQSYNTDIDHAVNKLKIATDVVANKLFVEVHYYSPWDFCGQETNGISLWGIPYKSFGTESTWGQEDYVRTQFGKMKTNFVDKGYPVILGEYGVTRRLTLTGTALTNHLAARAYYFQYITQQAKINGMVPCVWDNGGTGNNGMGTFNRADGSAADRQALKALMTGASSGTYPY